MHPSHLSAQQLLERGGFISNIDTGIYTLLPMVMPALRAIKALIQKEMNELGGQEILLPVLNPEESWKQTGRLRLAQEELLRLTDNHGNKLVLAPTHEQAAMELFASTISHADQLPQFIYQSQIKMRNEPSALDSLQNAREFMMHDGYSLHASFSSLNNFIPKIFRAYQRIFNHLGLPIVVADGLANHMGGDRSYDFFLPNPVGNYGLVRCRACGYEANHDVAIAHLPISSEQPRQLKTMVHLGLSTMANLQREIGVPSNRIAVSRLYWGFKHAILAVYRMDQTPSKDKLSRLCNDTIIKVADAAEIHRLGLVSEFLSPVGLRNRRLDQKGLIVIVDKLVAETANLIIGANAEDSYLIHSNFGRDFDADIVGDISRVTEDFQCRHCDNPLEMRRAIKLANILRIGKHYGRCFEHKISFPDGRLKYPSLGVYGINLSRLLIAIVENNRSSRGFVWPLTLSPFAACLIPVGWSTRVRQGSEQIYRDHQELLLFQDNDLSFLDRCATADRLGLRFRLVVTRASLAKQCVDVLDSLKGLRLHLPIRAIRSYLLELSRSETDC